MATDFNLYLKRYAFPEQLITTPPASDLGIVVAIPCFNEPNALTSLQALAENSPTDCSVEVILLINQPEECSDLITTLNNQTFSETLTWAENLDHSWLRVYPIAPKKLPKKHAGVGLARKMAMDEAVRRFHFNNQPDGVIVCFDADTICDENYLKSIEAHFKAKSETPGCTIYFEHPLDQSNSSGILHYELFLRYYVNALRYARFPFGFHTMGSAMAVRSWAYQKQGGMNRRKAGEDFYFLHRIVPLGNFSEINNTRVIPSPRFSNRVPFGTGRAMKEFSISSTKYREFYHPSIFEEMRSFLDVIIDRDQLASYNHTQPVEDFLKEIKFDKTIPRLLKHSTDQESYHKHFFNWFDGFMALKFVHHLRDHHYGMVPIDDALTWLLGESLSMEQALFKLRQIDRTDHIR